MNHTPGPWHVVKDESQNVVVGASDYESVRDNTRYMGHRICELGDWDGNKHDATQPHVIANAKLIAAAPELLEQLRDVVARIGKTPVRMDLSEAHALLKRLAP